MRELYPEIEPYQQGYLKVSPVHEIYYEQTGNPDGLPVVFVHGGPGGGTEPFQRRFFDPAVYRIVLFDQRGAGKSRPHASLEDNTTWHLVKDMEHLREELGIDRWVVFGGSWGSTLGLAYSETHPDRVRGIVVRGIFLVRPKEIAWFYQEGASFLFPDAWEEYLEPIPHAERGDMVSAYYRRLTSPDAAVRAHAARAWSVWEGATSRLRQDPKLIARAGGATFADALARIECHYFVHGSFLRHPDQLLDDAEKIRRIPGVIIQGRYDVVCPPISAWDLHRRWPEAEFHMVPDAGHSAMEPGIIDRLVEATDRFRTLPR
jgi:proline iminopeptidase